MDDPTARRFEDRSEAISEGSEAIEDEAPRVARGVCANGAAWSRIVEGYRSCEAMRRDYPGDVRAAYSRGAKDGVAAFKSDNKFRLWIGGWGIKLLWILGGIGLLVILVNWRRQIFGLLAGLPR